MKRSFTFLTTAIAVGLSACGGGSSKVPSATIVVDTNLPVPRVVTHVRFDFYTADGTWFDSRTENADDAKIWPLTFAIAGKETATTTTWVRIRAYNFAFMRTYTGEHFQPWPETISKPESGNGEPHLIQDGVDKTPSQEPAPEVAVDRLLKVVIDPEKQGRISVLLDGACAGHMAQLAPAWTSCHSSSEIRASEAPMVFDTTDATPTSRVGTLGQLPCPPAPQGHEAPCVEGGAFILGPSYVSSPPNSTVARIGIVPTFRMNQTEVTVAQMRRAVKDDGFVLPEKVGIGAIPLPTDPIDACTLTQEPGPRERYAMSCVALASARAYCNYYGGDLPTEAEWEYAATSAGRSTKSKYPWGEQAPSCGDAIFGRARLADVEGQCVVSSKDRAPLPIVDDQGTVIPTKDVTPQGIYHLAGGLSEWTRDSGRPADDACWLASPALSPSCAPTADDEIAIRGGAWASPASALISAQRFTTARNSINGVLGFRCVFH